MSILLCCNLSYVFVNSFLWSHLSHSSIIIVSIMLCCNLIYLFVNSFLWNQLSHSSIIILSGVSIQTKLTKTIIDQQDKTHQNGHHLIKPKLTKTITIQWGKAHQNNYRPTRLSSSKQSGFYQNETSFYPTRLNLSPSNKTKLKKTIIQ